MRNDKVLPDPVFAAPMISRPFKAYGMTLAYIFVYLIYSFLFRASLVFSEICKSLNNFSVNKESKENV